MSKRRSTKNVIIAIVVVGLIAFIVFAVTANTITTDERQKEEASILADKEAEISGLIGKVDEYAAMGGEFSERKTPVTPAQAILLPRNAL